MKLAVGAVLKNEAPYIYEWVAFHRAVGIDKIIILDNESEDGSSEILRSLASAKIIKTGHISGQGVQLAAYAEILNRAARCDWLAIIDLDEFLIPTDQSSIRPVIREIAKDKTVGAIAVNWALYGSSHHLHQNDIGVLERFQFRADKSFGPNIHYKSIIRPEAVVNFINPHGCMLREGFRTSDCDGETLKLSPHHGVGLSETCNWDRLRINHYIIKSKDEFIKRKRARGRASIKDEMRSLDFFAEYDRNDVEDPIPAELTQATTREMARIDDELNGRLLAPQFRRIRIFGNRAADFLKPLQP